MSRYHGRAKLGSRNHNHPPPKTILSTSSTFNMTTMDTDIDEEFRHIRLDDGPRLRPLGLDKMFTRVEKWGLAHPSPSPSTSQPTRPPSPPRRRGIYPLPRPQEGISPLGGLFDYPELLPLVLSHFDHPRDLAVLARVCSSWCKIARRRLYESVWVRPCKSLYL
jgi:hypothetical protein